MDAITCKLVSRFFSPIKKISFGFLHILLISITCLQRCEIHIRILKFISWSRNSYHDPEIHGFNWKFSKTQLTHVYNFPVANAAHPRDFLLYATIARQSVNSLLLSLTFFWIFSVVFFFFLFFFLSLFHLLICQQW